MPDFQLRFITLKQMTLTQPLCQVTVVFEFTETTSAIDIVQVYAVNAAEAMPAGIGDIAAVVNIDQPQTKQYTVTLTLQSASAYTVALCPRKLTGGVPDDQTEGAYWETFCVYANITTRGEQQPAPNYPTPMITTVEPQPANIHQPNRITVNWQASAVYDKFLIWWLEDGSNIAFAQGEVDTKGASGSWTAQPTRPGLTYDFQVKGGTSEFWNYIYTDWSPVHKVVGADNLTSLRQFLAQGGVSPIGVSIRTLVGANSSVRIFMQLS